MSREWRRESAHSASEASAGAGAAGFIDDDGSVGDWEREVSGDGRGAGASEGKDDRSGRTSSRERDRDRDSGVYPGRDGGARSIGGASSAWRESGADSVSPAWASPPRRFPDAAGAAGMAAEGKEAFPTGGLGRSSRATKGRGAVRALSATTAVGGTASDDAMSERVVLNVGGRRFECFASTLAAYPDTLLGAMFQPRNRHLIKLDSRGELFFDR